MREYLPCQKLQRKRQRPLRPPVRVRKLLHVSEMRRDIPVSAVWEKSDHGKQFFVFASRQWNFQQLVISLGLDNPLPKSHSQLMSHLAQNAGDRLAVGWQHPEKDALEKAIYGWHYWLQHLWLQRSDSTTLRLVYHNFLNAFRETGLSLSQILKHFEQHTYLDGFLLLLMSLAVRGELEMSSAKDIIQKLHTHLSAKQFEATVEMILQQLSLLQQKAASQVIEGVLTAQYPVLSRRHFQNESFVQG